MALVQTHAGVRAPSLREPTRRLPKVDDGKGGTATCSGDLTVAPKPNQNPTISCSTDRSPIMPGERTGITSTASDPDGDALTYSLQRDCGPGERRRPEGHVRFDRTAAGKLHRKVRCNDGKGGTAESSTNVDVQQPPPPPQATKAGDCGYNKAGVSRFDNACKRVGDDVALRLKNDPTAKLVIVGYADPKEPKATKTGGNPSGTSQEIPRREGHRRGAHFHARWRASKEKGQEKANRRVDFVIVPEGATY